jgi:zinc protease
MDIRDVKETLLPNGLKVLTLERHTAPVATCWIWYKVGSRNESPGITGVSHWVEHMLFKGAREFPKGELDKQVQRNGGILNGFTSNDFTAYFETLPSDKLGLGLRIEADRMRDSLFDPKEVDLERTVIISEREGYENYPESILSEEVELAAFRTHPYRWSVIGWKNDLRQMVRDDLYNYYRNFYAPDNAVLVVVGDFETGPTLRRIEELFGKASGKCKKPPIRSQEPEQEGERRVVVRRHGTTSYIQIAYHTPPITDPDIYPLYVLSAMMSGASTFSFSRNSTGYKTSRLYKALVKTKLASRAGCDVRSSIDPHLTDFTATVQAGASPEKVEEAMTAEINLLAKEKAPHDEVEKAKKQLLASFNYSIDTATSMALQLGRMEAMDSYRSLASHEEKIAAVTESDVQRVAAKYLTENNRTVGLYIPES